MFPPLTAEFCITEALNQVDTNAFPTLSTMFDESSTGNMFGDSVRQDFCFACCLHGLIAEESIEGLLGEMPMQSLPAGGRYTRDDLVQQCISNPERTDKLVEELLYMDGNVGAVSQAIAEVCITHYQFYDIAERTKVIRQYCHQKETMSLKSLCSNLARQPACLDVLLLFNKPRTVLQSLCELLDGWTYEEDQGEYTPVYEEFGSILLLVLALVHRYNLTVVDLNLSGRTSFMDKLLVRGATSRSMEELSELEKSQLEGWSRGLFNSAEGGGLGDEPMANCPPQDFYLLVPTLFHQVVLAYSSGHLSDEALKGGLECRVSYFANRIPLTGCRSR
jgi:mediator of RNA polymerase II transcription subunit 5